MDSRGVSDQTRIVRVKRAMARSARFLFISHPLTGFRYVASLDGFCGEVPSSSAPEGSCKTVVARSNDEQRDGYTYKGEVPYCLSSSHGEVDISPDTWRRKHCFPSPTNLATDVPYPTKS